MFRVVPGWTSRGTKYVTTAHPKWPSLKRFGRWNLLSRVHTFSPPAVEYRDQVQCFYRILNTTLKSGRYKLYHDILQILPVIKMPTFGVNGEGVIRYPGNIDGYDKQFAETFAECPHIQPLKWTPKIMFPRGWRLSPTSLLTGGCIYPKTPEIADHLRSLTPHFMSIRLPNKRKVELTRGASPFWIDLVYAETRDDTIKMLHELGLPAVPSPAVDIPKAVSILIERGSCKTHHDPGRRSPLIETFYLSYASAVIMEQMAHYIDRLSAPTSKQTDLAMELKMLIQMRREFADVPLITAVPAKWSWEQ
jgi:hypothetical protein